MSNISVINYMLSQYTQSSKEDELVQVGFNTYDMVFEITYRNKYRELFKVQELYYDLNHMLQYCSKVQHYLKTLRGFRTAEQLFNELKEFKL